MKIKWWNNLSVSKKLYTLTGVMAIIITLELITIFFAINTLSAVRSLVMGEALWSKAQKQSVFYIHRYSRTFDEDHYNEHLAYLAVPMGDRDARMELEKEKMDEKKISEGLLKGGNHEKDIPNFIKLVKRFRHAPYLKDAMDKWREADALFSKYVALTEEVHSAIQSKKSEKEVQAVMDKIRIIDSDLTVIENEFSYILSEGSRWLETTLMVLLVLALFSIEGTGLFLTFMFGRNLTKALHEFNLAAILVGKGDYKTKLPVRSQDELGQLSRSLNKMIENLDKKTQETRSAESASQTKNLFLANMSHEIRTPLNAILGFSSLLSDPDITDEEKKKYAEIIKRTGSSLNSIINDVLDLSKVEAEQVEVELTNFSLTQMLSDLHSQLMLKSEDKHIGLRFEKIGKVSDYIYSDQVRLRQIISNLVGNSIKFTERGEVTLTYEVRNDDLYFTVKDTGSGIRDVNHLFRPFTQGDSSVRKKHGGTGLGLFISKKLSQLLGGNVELLETSEKGSLFSAHVSYIPVDPIIEKKDVENEEILSSSIFQDKKILVVEDFKDNQLIIKLYMSKTGAILEYANNGKEGLEMAKSNEYDLILMDMQMPVMDGYTATQEIRAAGIKTTILAQTGYAMKEDQDKCLEAGCDGYISKPFDKFTLLKTVAKFL